MNSSRVYRRWGNYYLLFSLHSCLTFSFRVDSISKLKAQFKSLYKELDDPVKFKEIYRFSFNFTKEPDQKILGKRKREGIFAKETGTDLFLLQICRWEYLSSS
jgi:hypothetical protein